MVVPLALPALPGLPGAVFAPVLRPGVGALPRPPLGRRLLRAARRGRGALGRPLGPDGPGAVHGVGAGRQRAGGRILGTA